MKAIIVRQYGDPEVMKVEEVPTPAPSPGQILVRIKAAGVNPADTYARSGSSANKPPVPYTPGTDGAGVVESVGQDVRSVRPGARVYTARTLSGTYAEYSLALESQVHPLPERISFAQGAGVFVPYATAYRALFQVARVRPAETVLVHGASGGVGIAGVQTARAAGMIVLGTAGSPRGRELARKEGAHHVVDHTAAGYQEEILRLTGGRGVDVILEMLANVNLGADLKLLAPHGRVVVIGSRGDVTLTPRDLMSRDASIHGMLLWNISAEDAAQVHAALAVGMESGWVRPVVGLEMPLADAPRSHRKVLEPGSFGKIVLIP
ncbi:MAG TPA: NADPH:quinone reductase [Spirochaetia bacterium]|nr:NADPH:quinone reductase [Spirochaetia bacterium]